jgi:hypothetical protein
VIFPASCGVAGQKPVLVVSVPVFRPVALLLRPAIAAGFDGGVKVVGVDPTVDP